MGIAVMLSDQKGFPMRKLGTALLSLWGMLLILATAPAQAQLSTNLEINYYTIGQGDQDFGHLAGGHFSNEVMTTLSRMACRCSTPLNMVASAAC
ncbi:MAG: hypothetical protein P4L66_01200 [Acetobacteraceae bacterium]|nr:hypothetical protein [Acetobacteraceae bacterium]